MRRFFVVIMTMVATCAFAQTANFFSATVNNGDIEVEAHKIYDDTKKRIGPDGLVLPEHILIYVGQNPSDSLMQATEVRADSIYMALQKGANFEEMAKKYSQDESSARCDGEIGWISRGQTLKAFENAAFALKKGQISKPVLSEVGWHIIKIKDRKHLEPFDLLHDDIIQFIDKRNLRDQIAKNRLKDVTKTGQ